MLDGVPKRLKPGIPVILNLGFMSLNLGLMVLDKISSPLPNDLRPSGSLEIVGKLAFRGFETTLYILANQLVKMSNGLLNTSAV